MKRRYSEIEKQEDDLKYQIVRQLKKRKLNDDHIIDNNNQINMIIKKQQKIIEEFSKTVDKLNKSMESSNKKITKLEETVNKQQLILREVMPNTFNSPTPNYYY